MTVGQPHIARRPARDTGAAWNHSLHQYLTLTQQLDSIVTAGMLETRCTNKSINRARSPFHHNQVTRAQ